jgi:uncharacterized protein (TIGR00730 family)
VRRAGFKRVVTVFAGSSETADRYRAAARRLGRALAAAGWTVRTGAGRSPSLMGEVIDGARAAGGRVEGVILDKFLRVKHPALPTRVVRTMARRKLELVRGARALVVMPGGFGTMDELFEVLVLRQIGEFRGPVIVMNLGGYYDAVRAWMRRAVRERFIHRRHLRRLHWVRSVNEVLHRCRSPAGSFDRGRSNR